MPKFEYWVERTEKAVNFTMPTDKDMQDFLNKRGQDGWELIRLDAGVQDRVLHTFYIWRRQLPVVLTAEEKQAQQEGFETIMSGAGNFKQ